MQESSLSPRTTHVLGRLRHARLWLLLVLGSVAIVLFPWTAYLSATLPSEHVTHHWQVAWAGFDLFEAAALVATRARACPRRRPAGQADDDRFAARPSSSRP
jgi:hypothetical protein